MPDTIRISTPLVNRSLSVPQKNGPEPVDTFSLQNTPKVSKEAVEASELQKQDDTSGGLNYTPALLLSLLTDPEVMVSYLKNMNLLTELLKLVPEESRDEASGSDDILSQLFLKSDELPQEMKNQETDQTAFKGEIFDFLRKISDNNLEKPETQTAIAKFLQAAYNMGNRSEIAASCANNLSFLKREISDNSAISEKLDTLINEFFSKDAENSFPELKAQTLELVREMLDAKLLSPKAEEIASVIKYNLSRSDGSAEIVTEKALNLLGFLSPNEKQQFLRLFDSYLNQYLETGILSRRPVAEDNSKVISVLSKLISLGAQSDKTNPLGSERASSSLHSLLMTPASFTPLGHFFLPLNFNDMKALAEVWINRERDERDKSKNGGGGIHILMAVDVEEVGRFEAEFYVVNSTIDFNLYCPEGYEKDFKGFMDGMPKMLYGTEYHMGKTELAARSQARSLNDVFKSLPQRRLGVNVKA